MATPECGLKRLCFLSPLLGASPPSPPHPLLLPSSSRPLFPNGPSSPTRGPGLGGSSLLFLSSSSIPRASTSAPARRRWRVEAAAGSQHEHRHVFRVGKGTPPSAGLGWLVAVSPHFLWAAVVPRMLPPPAGRWPKGAVPCPPCLEARGGRRARALRGGRAPQRTERSHQGPLLPVTDVWRGPSQCQATLTW